MEAIIIRSNQPLGKSQLSPLKKSAKTLTIHINFISTANALNLLNMIHTTLETKLKYSFNSISIEKLLFGSCKKRQKHNLVIGQKRVTKK